MKKTRCFIAVFAGNMVFFSLYAAAAWLFALLDITPYGRFVNAFYRGRTAEEASAFMEANRVLYDVMLKDAAFFSSVIISPLVGLAAGFVAGAILHSNRRAALLWSVLMVVPVSALLLVKSSGDPLRFLYLFMLIVSAALGGYLGSTSLNKNNSEKNNVIN
jgi:hypothetical protein